MATVNPVIKDISSDGSIYLVTWTLTTANNDGAPISGLEWADRTILIQSTAYGASTTGLEGTNDTAQAYAPLADPQGGAISKTADAVEAVLEIVRYMRPRLTVVGTSAIVNVSMILRRANPRGR